MKAQILFIFCMTLLSYTGFSQDEEIELPYEMTFELKGIPTKIVFLEISVSANGALVDMIIGFQDPMTKTWIYFDASDVPALQDGFFTPFHLKLRKGFEGRDTKFITDILQPQSEIIYIWKCGCNESLPELPI